MRYILFLLFISMAHAEDLSLELSAGRSFFSHIHRDNYWCQEGFECNRDLQSGSWRLGISKKIDSKWSYSLSYLYLGESKVDSEVIPSDEVYEQCLSGKKSACYSPTARINVKSRSQGLELAAVREFAPLYVRGGLYLWENKTHLRSQEINLDEKFSGIILAPFIGMGVRYGYLFLEGTYYEGLGDGGFPIAKRAFTPMLGLRIPL